MSGNVQLELFGDTNLDKSDANNDQFGPVEALHDNEGTHDREFVDGASQALYEYVQGKQVSFREALDKYDVVSAVHDPAHGSYIVMAEREADKRLADPDLVNGIGMQEMGYSSPSPFLSWTRFDQNPKLVGKLGEREYYRMKRNDGTVRGSLHQLKTPVQSAHWFVDPDGDKARNKNAAKFVWENLSCYLNVSWARLLDDILLMCDYGYMAFEKVWCEPYSAWDQVRDGRLRYQKLAPRHPLDIRQWDYDRNGGPNGVIMEANPMEGQVGGIPIPIDKMAIFTYESEAGDMGGISVLRSAWKHYFYKDTLYKIDAIQKERHGIGIPIIKLPPGWSKTDLKTADALGRNLRTNERAHIVLPPLWEILFAELGGHPVDCMKSIEHHDKAIAVNILAPFMLNPSKTDEHDMFLKSSRYLAALICDTFNKHVIPPLIDANFTRVKYPVLRARRIGEWEDLRTMSFTLRNLVGADIIRPDDVLEANLREELDLPPMDMATIRTPVMVRPPVANNPLTKGETTAITDFAQSQVGQNIAGGVQPPKPAKAGLPRAKPLPPSGTGQGNAGNDHSGG